MTFELRAQNTSNQKLVVKSIAADLHIYSENKKIFIGDVSTFDPVEINPNSQVILELDGILQTIGIVTDLVTAFINKSFSMEVHIDGYANVDNYQIPINEILKIGL